MKRKIHCQFIFIAIVAILCSTVLSAAINYSVLKKEVMEDLKAYAHVLRGTGIFDNRENIRYHFGTDHLRLTVIAEDGTVVFDNNADVGAMDNHENREEVGQARREGEGRSVRRSDTLGRDAFYYTLLLENGCVLRVAKESRNITSVFLSSLPYMAGIVLLLILFSVFLAHFLTKSIISPIEQMAGNIGQKDVECVYRELRPFLSMIQKQHEDIIGVAEMRQQFTANVSHELKTPLAAISGYAELIENGMAADGDLIRFAGEIHQNANRLLTLINDILRLSELDATTDETVSMETLDLYPLAQSCVDMLELYAESHQVKMRLRGGSCIVAANREMMNELLFNLCDNAIRYNNQGGSVDVLLGTLEHGGGWLEIRDTGIGIPREHQERIFERFYRVDKSRSKSTGGTGLGLAIVKHIVEKNHASLELESEQGRGTRIRVTFPA